MEFGSGGIESFTFLPTYGGNRELPYEEQISVEIIRPPTRDRLVQEGETERDLFRWRDEHLSAWLQNPEFGEAIKAFSPAVLLVLKFLQKYTRKWKGILYDGAELTDPVEICLKLPIPPPSDPEPALVREVYDAIMRASALGGEQLKNFVSGCDGSSPEITTIQTGSPTAPPAMENSDPEPASTPAE